MSATALHLLGTFELRSDGETQTGFRSDKARALLAYLAVESDRAHRRDALATLLWPDQASAAAKANLRNVLSNLRALFHPPEASPLSITRQSVRFETAHAAVDTLTFASLYTRIHQTTAEPLHLLEQATALYRGDFLSGLSVDGSDAFDQWQSQCRESYHRQAMQLFDQLATHFLARGNHQRVAQLARQQLELEPWHEPAHRRLMQALSASGQRTAALEQFERCRQILAEELGAEPEEATLLLAQRIRGETNTASSQRTNIPHIASSFLGREPEISAIAALCAPGNKRLVTLLGIGGVGKSRLAQAVGQQLLADFPDGIWWVSLEAVQPGEGAANRMAVAIAAGLDLPLSGSENVREQLFAHLRARQALLILDNSEHLTSESGLLLALLNAAPRLCLLVTSRVRLNLPGEWPVTVRGLPPEPAAALFITRAQAVVPDFADSPESRPAIDRICQLVEGLPLGIELAAIWTEHFSCDEIADAIAQSSTFLARQNAARGAKTPADETANRHDSLRAIFEHSWQLLPATERWVLAQLSVFRGEFSREAVQAVTVASLSEISALLGKSLLRLTRPGRYNIHEVVRTFAHEKLQQSPQWEQVETHRRYRHHYLQRVQNAGFLGLRQDLENIRAAWQAAVQAEDQPLLALATSGLADLLRGLGLLQDGADLLGAALDKAAGDLAAALLLEVSAFAQILAGSAEALAAARRGLIHTQTPQLRARLYSQIATALAESGDWQAAEDAHLCQEAAARQSGDRLLLAAALHEHAHAQVIHFVGDYADAIGRMEKAMVLLDGEQAANNPRTKVLRGLAMAHLRNGSYDRSLAYGRQMHTLAQKRERPIDLIDALMNLGLTSCFAGQYDEAIRHSQNGLLLAEQAGDREGIGLLRSNLCLIYRNAGDLPQARSCGEIAVQILQALQRRRIEGQCRNRLGHTLLAQGRSADAQAMYASALAVWQLTDNPNRYEALAGQALALFQLGQTDQALALVADVLLFAVGDAWQRVVEPVQMLLHCAAVLRAAEQAERANAVLGQARQWVESIASRNADPAIRHSLRQNVPAHRQLFQMLVN